MNRETQTYRGRTWERVSKRTAEKIWSRGGELLLQSSNMRFNTHWQSPCPVKDDGRYDTHVEGLTSFGNMCNEFMYFNCDSGRGRYIRFYAEIKERGTR